MFQNVTIHRNRATLSVSAPSDSCKITLSNVGQGGGFMQTFDNVSSATFVDVPNSCTISYYKT